MVPTGALHGRVHLTDLDNLNVLFDVSNYTIHLMAHSLLWTTIEFNTEGAARDQIRPSSSRDNAFCCLLEAVLRTFYPVCTSRTILYLKELDIWRIETALASIRPQFLGASVTRYMDVNLPVPPQTQRS